MSVPSIFRNSISVVQKSTTVLRFVLNIYPTHVLYDILTSFLLNKLIWFVFQKSWDIALGPLKQIPMNLFIMWMAGNSISIFPIMMVGMMFVRPIQALAVVQQSKYQTLYTCQSEYWWATLRILTWVHLIVQGILTKAILSDLTLQMLEL